jgi:hypothetical protein
VTSPPSREARARGIQPDATVQLAGECARHLGREAGLADTAEPGQDDDLIAAGRSGVVDQLADERVAPEQRHDGRRRRRGVRPFRGKDRGGGG